MHGKRLSVFPYLPGKLEKVATLRLAWAFNNSDGEFSFFSDAGLEAPNLCSFTRCCVGTHIAMGLAPIIKVGHIVYILGKMVQLFRRADSMFACTSQSACGAGRSSQALDTNGRTRDVRQRFSSSAGLIWVFTKFHPGSSMEEMGSSMVVVDFVLAKKCLGDYACIAHRGRFNVSVSRAEYL